MEKTFSSSSKILFSAFIALLGIILIIHMSSISGEQTEPNNAGREVRIYSSEVNVREDHSLSAPVITTLRNGDTVVLTGNSYEYIGGDDSATDNWVEIQLEDGTTGWVVRRSINWW